LVTYILIVLPRCMRLLMASPRFLLWLNLIHVLSVPMLSSIRLLMVRLPLVELRNATKGSWLIWGSWSKLLRQTRIASNDLWA
jgi:hypothetical protein